MKHFEIHIAYLVILFAFYFVAFSLVPYQWYVNITKFEYEDICVGESLIPVHTERKMSWWHNRFGLKGDVWSQAILFEDNIKLETTINRASKRPDGRVTFGYEPFSTESNFQIALDQPIMKAGTYGLNEWVNIYPLPFIVIKDFIPAEENQFEVTDCNI